MGQLWSSRVYSLHYPTPGFIPLLVSRVGAQSPFQVLLLTDALALLIRQGQVEVPQDPEEDGKIQRQVLPDGFRDWFRRSEPSSETLRRFPISRSIEIDVFKETNQNFSTPRRRVDRGTDALDEDASLLRVLEVDPPILRGLAPKSLTGGWLQLMNENYESVGSVGSKIVK